MACLCVLALAAFAGSSAPAASAACPNEQLRRESNSLNLADCRAYEQVSPRNKENNDARSGLLTADGKHAYFGGSGTFAGAPRGGANDYLATYTPTGWRTMSITPPLPAAAESSVIGVRFAGFTADATSWLMQTGDAFDPTDTWENSTDFYLGGPDGSARWVSRPAPGMPVPIYSAFFPGPQTADLSSGIFQDTSPRVPAASAADTYSYGVYEWRSDGPLRLASVDSAGALINPWGAVVGGGPGSGKYENALSADGERIYFTTPGNIFTVPAPYDIKRIYLRQSAQTTTEISATQCTEVACEGPAKDALYQSASADGSVAFFTSTAQLTNEATPGGGLYRFTAATGKLDLLTPDATDPGGAGVRGEVVNSEDGSLVYFVATGALATGATAGDNNLYVYDAKTSTTNFIAALAPGESSFPASSDAPLWFNDSFSRPAETTPSGRDLIFHSDAPLAPGYDTAGRKQIYRYHQPTQTLSCLSCLPAGTPSQGDSFLEVGAIENHVSDDGSYVFFESRSQLVPLDRNSKIDVYQWHDGAVSLISSGTSIEDSRYSSATPSGDEVLITTGSRLVPQDEDDQTDVYGARIGGGFPFSTPPTSCVGAGCRGPAGEAPALPSIGSSTFSGRGNAVPKRAKPCRKKAQGNKKQSQAARSSRAAKKCGKKKPNRSHNRTTNHNRRAGR